MRKIPVLVLVLAVLGAAALYFVPGWNGAPAEGSYRTARADRGEIVATTFHKQQVEIRKALEHVLNRSDIDRSIFSNRRMWAAASLYTYDTFKRQGMTTAEKFGILTSGDIVGDDRNIVSIA